MVRDNEADIFQKICDAIVDQTYVVTPHALFEMRDNGLDLIDVESAILRDDPRGVRFEVVGTASDLATRVGVVLRNPGVWLILTVYEIKG